MRDINKIIVHHSESPGGDVRFLRYIHKHDNGWKDVGYHYVICNGKKHGDWKAGEDGEIQEGRPVKMVGAHARGANTGSIGICLIGDFMTTLPTQKQIMSLTNLCAELCGKYDIKPVGGIQGHRDVNSTDCPGTNLYSLLSPMRIYLEAVKWYAGKSKLQN